MSDDTPVTPWWELSGMERELAKYDQCEEPGDCDHDHDNAIEYFREQELNALRERAEKAEAELQQHRAAVQRVRHLIAHPYGAARHVPGYVNAADLLAAIEPQEKR